MQKRAIIVFIFSFILSFCFRGSFVFAKGIDESMQIKYEFTDHNSHQAAVYFTKQEVSWNIKEKYFEPVSNKRFIDSQSFYTAPAFSLINTSSFYRAHFTNISSYLCSFLLAKPSRSPPSSLLA
jgi:hypothetical protein